MQGKRIIFHKSILIVCNNLLTFWILNISLTINFIVCVFRIRIDVIDLHYILCHIILRDIASSIAWNCICICIVWRLFSHSFCFWILYFFVFCYFRQISTFCVTLSQISVEMERNFFVTKKTRTWIGNGIIGKCFECGMLFFLYFVIKTDFMRVNRIPFAYI